MCSTLQHSLHLMPGLWQREVSCQTAMRAAACLMTSSVTWALHSVTCHFLRASTGAHRMRRQWLEVLTYAQLDGRMKQTYIDASTAKGA